MRFAYIITCHKNAEQVLRLVAALNSPDNTIVIHVSTTCEKGFFDALTSAIAKNKQLVNVFFCKRENGTLAGFGIVKGSINGLNFLIKNNIEFDYVSLVSGQDYPIKSNVEINNFFEGSAGKLFLYYFPLTPKIYPDYYYDESWGPDRQIFRIDRYHFIIDGEVLSIPELETARLVDHSLLSTIKIFLFESKKYIKQKRFKKELGLLLWSRVLPRKRKIPDGFNIFGGITWWSINRDAAKYVLDQHFNNKRYRNFFRYTLIPDEMYFQTILLNSPFAENCVNNDLRDIEWTGGDGTHPVIFKTEHLNRLKESTDLFARKFDINVDSNVLDLIDKELLNK
jgi:hypothetical protein